MLTYFIFIATTGEEQIPLAGAIFLGLMLSCVVGIGAGALLAYGVADGLVKPKLTRAPLRGAANDLHTIARDTDAILKLNPPAEVLSEVLAMRVATNQVTENLISLTLLMPKENLNESSPRKWLRNTVTELARVRSELEEARFQSYVEPIPLMSLETSSKAIAEERRFVSEVLGRASDSTNVISEDVQVLNR